MPRSYVVRKKCHREVCFDDLPVPQEQYWAAFPDRAAAEAHALVLDRAEILVNGTDANPFNRGVEGATTLPVLVFRDWLMEAGIDPPAWGNDTRSAWQSWWSRVVVPRSVLTRDQFARLLEALNLLSLRFYEVEEVESVEAQTTAETVYAVVHSAWRYNDSTFDGRNKGLKVYRDRGRALAECDRLNCSREPKPERSDDLEDYAVVELLYDPDRGASVGE